MPPGTLGWWPTYPVAHICLLLADVGLFVFLSHFFWPNVGLFAGGPPRQLIDKKKLTKEGGPSRLLLAGWGFSSGVQQISFPIQKPPPGQDPPGWATHF